MDKEILENNKLIALFMGRCGKVQKHLYTFKGVDTLLNGDLWYSISGSKFHSSWDWLMPVIEKIVIWDDTVNKDFNNGHVSRLLKSLSWLDIKTVYNRVIKFIKWYNEQKN